MVSSASNLCLDSDRGIAFVSSGDSCGHWLFVEGENGQQYMMFGWEKPFYLDRADARIVLPDGQELFSAPDLDMPEADQLRCQSFYEREIDRFISKYEEIIDTANQLNGCMPQESFDQGPLIVEADVSRDDYRYSTQHGGPTYTIPYKRFDVSVRTAGSGGQDPGAVELSVTGYVPEDPDGASAGVMFYVHNNLRPMLDPRLEGLYCFGNYPSGTIPSDREFAWAVYPRQDDYRMYSSRAYELLEAATGIEQAIAGEPDPEARCHEYMSEYEDTNTSEDGCSVIGKTNPFLSSLSFFWGIVLRRS